MAATVMPHWSCDSGDAIVAQHYIASAIQRCGHLLCSRLHAMHCGMVTLAKVSCVVVLLTRIQCANACQQSQGQAWLLGFAARHKWQLSQTKSG
jgi:hypothetical protein